MYSISKSIKLLIILFIFLLIGFRSDAQTYWENDTINFYKLSFGMGAGKGYPQQKAALGPSAIMESTYQRKKQLFSIGINALSDCTSSEDKNVVSNSVSAVNLTYGRAYTKRRFYASLNTGISFVSTEEKGKAFCECGNNYEKIKDQTVGLAVSFKILKISPYFGKGFEFFMNMNSKSSFGGINLCIQFGKLKKDEGRKIECDTFYREI